MQSKKCLGCDRCGHQLSFAATDFLAETHAKLRRYQQKSFLHLAEPLTQPFHSVSFQSLWPAALQTFPHLHCTGCRLLLLLSAASSGHQPRSCWPDHRFSSARHARYCRAWPVRHSGLVQRRVGSERGGFAGVVEDRVGFWRQEHGGDRLRRGRVRGQG
jgi:hypothetical protein